jgi:glycosyltransferase involved in cell wall biosynthesis
MNKPKISIVSPCWKRPARTRRLINNILAQTINGWEAFIIGDGCPIFQTLIDSGEADFYMKLAKEKGNLLYIANAENHTGNWGQAILDYIIDKATGEYFTFVGNDDRLLPNHFKHYLSEIENTEYDLVAYSSYIIPENKILTPQWGICQVGHGNIIVKTSVLQQAPKVKASETHDWSLINELIKIGAKTKLAESQECTYLVTSIRSQEINESIKRDIID